MGNATQAALQGIAVYDMLRTFKADVRRDVLADVVTRLEGFGVDPAVIEHFRTLRDV